MSAHEEAGRAGQVIGGKYQLVRCIGRGGMGSVWQAMHVTLGAPVALKLIDPALLRRQDIDPAEVLKRFHREAQAAATVRSPHVVQILDHGIDGTTPWMALEMLEGESLEQRLARVRVLPFREAARFVTHVARALTRAHEAGLVHRDLKPSNIFLVRNEDEEIAKILDFGLVKIRRAPLANQGSDLTAGRVLGTPYYMSPEQALGKNVDHRTDLWALGIITFECVVGRLPFETDVLTQLLVDICVKPLPAPSSWADVPPGFDEWFAKATNRDASQRFQTAREMADALRAVLAPDETVNIIATGRFVLNQVAPQVAAAVAAPAAAAAPAPAPAEPLGGYAAPAPPAAAAEDEDELPTLEPTAAAAAAPAGAPAPLSVSDPSDMVTTLLRPGSGADQPARESAEKSGLSVSSDITRAALRSQKRLAVGALLLLAAAGVTALAIGLSGGPPDADPAASQPDAAPSLTVTAEPTAPASTPAPSTSASEPPTTPSATTAPTRTRTPVPTQKSKKDPVLGF